MMTKTFGDPVEAVEFAHAVQQGGYDCSLIVKRHAFVVTKRENEHEYYDVGDFIERFDASNDAKGFDAES